MSPPHFPQMSIIKAPSVKPCELNHVPVLCGGVSQHPNVRAVLSTNWVRMPSCSCVQRQLGPLRTELLARPSTVDYASLISRRYREACRAGAMSSVVAFDIGLLWTNSHSDGRDGALTDACTATRSAAQPMPKCGMHWRMHSHACLTHMTESR